MIENIIASFFRIALELFQYVLFANIILSWFVHSTQNMTVRQIYWWTGQFVDPVLDPIRRLLRPYMGGMPIDISPIFLIMLLSLLARIIG